MKQLDRRDFRPPPILSPTRKGSLPLTWWAIDLVTHMGDPPYMIVAVDPFSKWVEAGSSLIVGALLLQPGYTGKLFVGMGYQPLYEPIAAQSLPGNLQSIYPTWVYTTP